jgi:GNAT superfamily N-acetyltransferase
VSWSDIRSIARSKPKEGADTMRYQLRQLNRGDVAELVEFHDRCSDETRYRRFLQAKPRLLLHEARRFCGVDQCRDGAIVAFDPDCPDKIRGVGRWAGVDETMAEVAFVVEDEYQGHGIGRSLVSAVIACVRDVGFTTLIGDVLAANTSMRHVLRTSGCPLVERHDDFAVLSFSLDLTSPMALAA